RDSAMEVVASLHLLLDLPVCEERSRGLRVEALSVELSRGETGGMSTPRAEVGQDKEVASVLDGCDCVELALGGVRVIEVVVLQDPLSHHLLLPGCRASLG